MTKLIALTISIVLHVVIITNFMLPKTSMETSELLYLNLKQSESKKEVETPILPEETPERSELKPEKKQFKKWEPEKEKSQEKIEAVILDRLPSDTVKIPVPDADSDNAKERIEKSFPSEDVSTINEPVDLPVVSVDLDAICQAYQQSILQKIDQTKVYPHAAWRRSKEGRVNVEFVVNSDGSVKNPAIIEEAGFSQFNKSALDAVTKAAPFDPIPPELNLDHMKLSLWITFRISATNQV